MLGISCSLLSLATAKVTQASLNASRSDNTAMQARSVAASEAELVRATNYTDLKASQRTAVAGTAFEREVTLSSESNYNDATKKRTATIKVYKAGENLPRAEVALTRYSTGQAKSTGVPVGAIIAWYGNKAPTEGGTWLLCNGQSCNAYPALTAAIGRNTVPDMRSVVIPTSRSTNISVSNASISGPAVKIGAGSGFRFSPKYYSLILGTMGDVKTYSSWDGSKIYYWGEELYQTGVYVCGASAGTASFPISNLTGVSANLISSLSLNFYIKAA